MYTHTHTYIHTYIHILHMKVKVLVAQLCGTLCDSIDCSCQRLLSMGFSGQEYCSGYPFSFPVDFSDPGIKPRSLSLQADSLPSESPQKNCYIKISLHTDFNNYIFIYLIYIYLFII